MSADDELARYRELLDKLDAMTPEERKEFLRRLREPNQGEGDA